ncbi:acyl-CoA dehydrogenase [Sphingobium sp. SCG-1]|uniref:acyl-CoA dehydrogenase family protein n=1 Tax=Sphingobium sp. SCG-1 TaxID=2072936 RepID=UPI000CD6A357|nr:acyl-CoA dehydrogenase family protein [Sphingobium sp. SCG-1]AUW59659.1 acyl-CoA dehydrogenase [Sphingobium sp. SCG-1]
MISFELTEEQKIIQSTIAEFAREELSSEARRLDDAAVIDAGVLGKLWATEFIQLHATVDEEERSAVTSAIVLEELGAADAGLALAMASTMAFVGAVADQGTQEQRETLLPHFTGGSFQPAAVAIMEPSFGFDVERIEAKAARSGDDYTLNGKKAMVPLAGKCSHFLVIAQCDGALDALIVPREAAGVSVAETKGTMGLRALELAEVTFENVRVPAAARLSGGNGADVQRIIDGARTGVAAILTGLCRGVIEYVIPYTKERIVHGTALARKQTIAFNIADMHMDIEAMRWMTWKAASDLEHRRPSVQSAQLAYTYAGQQAVIITDNGLQALGGHGYTKEHPIELWYRNARALSVLEGIAGV